MMKKWLFLPIILGAITLFLTQARPVVAFTSNNLIDDSVFDNSSTMTAAQIDSWLNSKFSSSCISTNSGFSAPDPTGYSPSTGFTYGGPVSAGRVIYDAAAAYGLNPQVLLTTLQKEESLVDGGAGCSALRYSASVGYGCPDGGTTYNYSNLNPAMYYINGTPVNSINGTCVKSAADVGFAQQLIHASWLLKFGEQRSKGNTNWDVQNDNFPQSGDHWDNSDDPQTCYSGPMTQGNFKRCSTDSSTTFFDGYTIIDGTSTHMDTGATAALYWYTPHFSGNQSFDNIFDNWFGSTYTPAFAWQEVGMTILDQGKNAAIPTDYMHSGDRLYVQLTVMNTGTATWTNTGPNPLRLGTQLPQDGYTPYCDITWVQCNRAATLSEASVAPGGTGHFYFYMAVPNTRGAYRYWFEPLLENQSWMSNGTNYNIYVNNTGQYDWQWLYYNAYTDSSMTTPVDINNLSRNQQVYIVLYLKNNSADTWQNNNANPADLGTSGPQDRMSQLCTASWISCNRPTKMNESSVPPGGTATFSFTIKTPAAIGSYREFFKPVLEFSGWGEDSPQHIYLNVTH